MNLKLKEFKIEVLESHVDVLLINIKSMAKEIGRLHAILNKHDIDILTGEQNSKAYKTSFDAEKSVGRTHPISQKSKPIPKPPKNPPGMAI